MGILGDRGYTIRLASDGLHALTTIRAEPPDLILLDIIMPEMNGYEVCEQLKAGEDTRDIPILFISALNKVSEKVKAFSVGGVDYINKPFQPEEVIARVETHLALRNLQKSLQKEVVRRQQAEEEQRVLNAQLQEANQQLREANASKNKFFSIIAHDLRSPLGTFRELSHLLVENIQHYEKDELIRMMRTQRDSANRLYGLLDNLLTWARSQQQHIEYHPQKIDLQSLIMGNVMLLSPDAAQKHITLNNSIQEKMFVYADSHMLNTVVLNLLSNALKFTKPQGNIEVSATSNGQYVEVAVSDTGIGIPVEYLSKLFRIDTTYRQTGTANERGTGLGLILCQEFVERHGGRIWMGSDAGKGTTVKFALPKKRSE
jgi:signal transduction histidine kinase